MKKLQLARYNHLGLSVFLGLLLSLIALTTIHAQQPGDLDTTFNPPHGAITTPIGIGADWAYDVAIQPDGKIVVVGYSETNIDSDPVFAIARYTVTGALDSTFNSTGIVTTPIGNDSGAGSVALQSDGKIVVAGFSRIDNDHQDFAVARYTVTGTLDSDFNQIGIVTTSIDNLDAANSVALQPDGKIVVAGFGGPDYDHGDFTVVRYTITGALDSTFNYPYGVVTTPIGNDANDAGASSVAIQPDGKIVVTGPSNYDFLNGTGDFAVVRYTITGALDSTFKNTGIITTPFSNGVGWPYDVTLQPDGKIVTVGRSGSDFAVVRYTITGMLDSTFNNTGIVTTSISVVQEAYDVAVQPNRKIVVVGVTGLYYTTVVRYHSDGSLDTTFHQTGIVTTAVGPESGAEAVALQPDGKIVVVGTNGDPYPENFFVARYWGDRYAYLPTILKD